MTDGRDKTEQRITTTALELFLTLGIKKTSVDDIAHAAGLTRVTLYRYFPQREQLIHAAFQRVLAPIQHAREWVERTPDVDIDAALESIALELAALPRGNLSLCLAELRRVQPSIHDDFSQKRREALKTIFDRLMIVAQQQGRLRAGLNLTIVEAYFIEVTVGFLDRALSVGSEVSPSELFTTTKDLFLYGILKEKPS